MAFTSFTPKSFILGGYVPAAGAVMYTVPTASGILIDQMVINNTDQNNAHTVTIYLNGNSGTATAQNALVTRTLAAGESFSVYQAINEVLSAGGTIQAQCDADSSVVMFASGVLMS